MSYMIQVRIGIKLHAFAAPDRAGSLDGFDWQNWALCWVAGEIEREIESRTWRAFWLSAVEGIAPADVASRLEMKIGAVYAAKCRVLARVRQRVQELSRSRP
jgi:hypothetical protein